MNSQQIRFNEGVIRINRKEIARLKSELQNHKIRKPEKRLAEIYALMSQIEQAEKMLEAAQ